jgi:ring-1,2-phenylacetyl-CoA epoxidase subunit PaaD
MVTPEQRAIMEVAMAHEMPSLDALWRALGEVPDPEIPGISIVELGIVRGVEWEQGQEATVVIVVTPTYSGCPATASIIAAIKERLAFLGIERLRIETRLAPAWTTDWMTPAARRKLREYGIAPPSRHAAAHDAVPIDISAIRRSRKQEAAVPCPRCESLATKLVSAFGSTACKAHYRCDDCLEPFEYFKPH